MKNHYEVLTKDKVHHIYERPTDTSIKLVSGYKDACGIVRNLNKGAGFNGFTPSFFVKTAYNK